MPIAMPKWPGSAWWNLRAMTRCPGSSAAAGTPNAASTTRRTPTSPRPLRSRPTNSTSSSKRAGGSSGRIRKDWQEFCPPEVDPDPSQPVHTIDPKTGLSEQPVAWRSVPTGEAGRVDLRAAFNADHFSAYALNIIYSPDERSATLWVGGDDHVRVWLNGRLVHEASPAGITRFTEERVPIALCAGRNVLLAKVSQNSGAELPEPACGRDGALDCAFALAEMGLWDEAANEIRQANPQKTGDAWLAVRICRVVVDDRRRRGLSASLRVGAPAV